MVMYRHESWTIRKAECWRIDAFEPEVLEKTLEGPLRRSNQSILKEISPDYSLEGLMLKLKLQSFGHLMWGTDSLEKRPWCREILKSGGQVAYRGWDGWMSSPPQWTWVSVKPGSWWWTGKRGVVQSMGSQRVRHDWVSELNWVTKNWPSLVNIFKNVMFFHIVQSKLMQLF